MSRPVLRTTARGRQGPRGPEGPDGPRGLPATNAAEDDAAIATFASTPGTATHSALTATFVQSADLTPLGEWQYYTPTFTNIAPFISQRARYVLIGKSCRVQFSGTVDNPTLTSGTSFAISLPFAAAATHPTLRSGPIGTVLYTDNNPGGSYMGAAVLTANRTGVAFISGVNYWGNGSPAVLATGDYMAFTVEYEVA